jgi:hypothetical protein
VRRLETDAVYSDGKITPGTPDQITGGVFTVDGAHVDLVKNRGPVVTYGVNDMVLDNWGVGDRWIAEEKITSYGPSGIGFVNFGIVNELRVNALSETFGQGASAREIDISGGLKTNGAGAPPIEQHGAIETLRIAGGCIAAGGGFENI